ncbi:hypothetical protein GCM10010988_28850 [Cnuibacter physcomitrellae]|nr:hypothetical protein GCM10010988_28850 [Cnuibacter physcomitrellae]
MVEIASSGVSTAATIVAKRRGLALVDGCVTSVPCFPSGRRSARVGGTALHTAGEHKLRIRRKRG